MRKGSVAMGGVVIALLCAFFAADAAVAGQGDVASLLTGVSAEGEYDGYLVGLYEDRVRLTGTDEGELDRVADGLYRFDSLEAAEDVFAADQIAFIEPDYYLWLADADDPLVENQWHLDYLAAPVAWYRGLDGAGVRVALIDSGLRTTHEDLNPDNILPGWNYIDDNGDVTDVIGHGTQVAGILAAVRGNGVGGAGLADGVELVPLKVFDDRYSLVSDVVAAVYDAVDEYDCRVINMSFGSVYPSRTLKRAVDYAHAAGVIMVAAVGNYGDEQPVYPAAYDEVIGVAALTDTGDHAGFSSCHEGAFIAAPGERIRTLSADGDSRYTSVTGTSMAAPMVTGAVAMALGTDPDMTEDELRALLIDSCIDLGEPGCDYLYGHGALSLDRLSANLTGVSPVEMQDAGGHWARDSIYYAVENGLMIGVGNGAFAPDARMTRAMMVTLLGRYYTAGDGVILAESCPFTDLEEGAYYVEYVAWAHGAGIVRGYDGATFGPDDEISREQALQILYNYQAYTGEQFWLAEGVETVFQYADSEKVSAWAVGAMAWGLSTGIIQGEPDGSLAPDREMTRAEVATVLHRYITYEPAP